MGSVVDLGLAVGGGVDGGTICTAGMDSDEGAMSKGFELGGGSGGSGGRGRELDAGTASDFELRGGGGGGCCRLGEEGDSGS